MELTPEEKDLADNYELDLKNTIVSNFPLLMGFIVAIFYVSVFANMLNTFTLPEMKIIGMFVWGYSTIKIVSLITNLNLEYKLRK